jgi:hypothetical protein
MQRVPVPYLSKTEDRLVVLSFVYNNGKDEVAVWRTGPGKPDISEEEWMSKARNNPKTVTIELKSRGIGSSRSLATRAIDIESLPQLRDSFSSMYRLAVNSHDSTRWLGQLMGTKWYEQVGTILQEASLLVQQLTSKSAHVTVLADAEVRGAQLVALAQVLLFPECRTLKGFGDLLEREFLQWGGTRAQLRKDV